MPLCGRNSKIVYYFILTVLNSIYGYYSVVFEKILFVFRQVFSFGKNLIKKHISQYKLKNYMLIVKY